MSEVSDLRGAVLGKGYRLDRRLGDHHDHEYEGTHERIPGRFIIRLFPVEILSQPESSSRIQRGARVASLLRDPHAVQILDFSASGDVPVFVVIERTPGRSLASAMLEDGMAPLPRAIDLIASIAAGLSAGHQIGLVHGDLRPQHVILSSSGQPLTRVSGFGWAKELRAAARIPTPSNYLAPEQDFGKVLTLDERVDQFALAVLAYELIAGCLPFSVESADLAEKLGGLRTPPAIADMVPGVPGQIDEVLRRALSFTPSDRFDGVNDFISQLRASSAALTVPTPEPSIQTPKTSSSVPRVKTPATARPSPILLTSSIVGATPAVKSDNDVTDELDLPILAPARDPHTASDGDDDEKLVLGPASGPTVTDEAKTQIRRSPFLNDYPDNDEPGQGSAQHVPSTPRRGVPTGRPATLEVPHGSDSRLLVVSSIRSEVASAFLLSIRERVAPLWSPLQKRWPFILSAAAVVLAIGVGIWMAGSSHEASTTPSHAPSTEPTKVPAPEAAVATAPKKPTPIPREGPPAAPAPPSAALVATSDRAGGAEVDPPSPQWPAIAPQPEPLPLGTARGKTITSSRGSPRRPTARHAAKSTAIEPSRPEPAAPDTEPRQKDSRPAAVGPGDCSLHIVSSPWAYVWVDGKNTGLRTPVDKLRVPCGMRKLQLKRADKDIEQMEMLQVEPGKPFEGKYELQ